MIAPVKSRPIGASILFRALSFSPFCFKIPPRIMRREFYGIFKRKATSLFLEICKYLFYDT